MSRSIHTTRRTFSELRKKTFPTVEAKAIAYKKARQQIHRKRLIKRQVKAERSHPLPLPISEVSVSMIPIEVLDEGRFIHHGASVGDLRAVLKALPTSAVEGIGRIQLSLGRQYMDERNKDGGGTRDPHTGRLSNDVFPHVYGGDFLGTFWNQSGLIAIYAYVYDPKHLPLPRFVCDIYLRLQALMTLVHEVAHYHDETRRVARGRWLADRKENVERYAENMEYKWTHEVVLPYLERTYPKETRALCAWVAQRGGIQLPLEFFAGDGRRTKRNGLMRLCFSTSGAFESWVANLHKCGSLVESWLAFAWELHYANAYEDCLQVLQRVLDVERENLEALVCEADTLVHLERYEEAFVIAERILEREPKSSAAWETRADVLEHRHDWSGLLETCDRWEACLAKGNFERRWPALYRAIAFCALGREADIEASLQAHLACIRFQSEEAAKRRAIGMRRIVFRRAGKPLPDNPPAKFAR